VESPWGLREEGSATRGGAGAEEIQIPLSMFFTGDLQGEGIGSPEKKVHWEVGYGSETSAGRGF